MTPTCDVGPGRAEACRLPTMTPPAPASCTCPSSTPHPPLVPPPPPLSPSLSCPPAMGTVPPPPPSHLFVYGTLRPAYARMAGASAAMTPPTALHEAGTHVGEATLEGWLGWVAWGREGGVKEGGTREGGGRTEGTARRALPPWLAAPATTAAAATTAAIAVAATAAAKPPPLHYLASVERGSSYCEKLRR